MQAPVFVCHGHVEVVEYLYCDLLEKVDVGELPCAEIHAGQLCVVIEHLLEVRDDPLGIDGVAGKPTEEVVVDAALRHGGQLADEHVEAVFFGVGAGQERSCSQE